MKVTESKKFSIEENEVYIFEENYKLSDNTKVSIYTDFCNKVYITKNGEVLKEIYIYEFQACITLNDYMAIQGHEELMLYNLRTLENKTDSTR